MSTKRVLQVIEAGVEVGPSKARLGLRLDKARKVSHALEPRPEVTSKEVDRVDTYQVVSRPGAGSSIVRFKVGEIFSIEEGDLPRTFQSRVTVLEGPPWPEKDRPLAPEKLPPEFRGESSEGGSESEGEAEGDAAKAPSKQPATSKKPGKKSAKKGSGADAGGAPTGPAAYSISEG